MHGMAQGKLPAKHYVSAGAGFPNLPRLYFNSVSNSLENFEASGSGPFHLKYENRVSRWFGVGASVNYMSYKVTYISERAFDTAAGRIVPNHVNISSSNTAINLRGNVHFINPEKHGKVDVYFGMGLGYKFGKPKLTATVPESTPSIELPAYTNIGFETTFGFRYYIQDHVGFYTELGVAKSVIQAGATVRW